MTVRFQRPSKRTIVTGIRVVTRDEPNLPDCMKDVFGREFAPGDIMHEVAIVVEGKPERFFYRQYEIAGSPHGSLVDAGRIFGMSSGSYKVLQPFMHDYMEGKIQSFPVDLGLV